MSCEKCWGNDLPGCPECKQENYSAASAGSPLIQDMVSQMEMAVAAITLMWDDYVRIPTGHLKDPLEMLIKQVPEMQKLQARYDNGER